MDKPVVRAEALTTHHDPRGNLTELIHCYDLPQSRTIVEHAGQLGNVPIQEEKLYSNFGQVYVVRNEQAGTIRAFHVHERQWDYFTVVNGKAQVWIVNPEKTEAERFILSGANLTRLIIPPNWWHGWESLMPNTILISTITDVYNRENPDEKRVKYTEFAHLNVKWDIEPY